MFSPNLVKFGLHPLSYCGQNTVPFFYLSVAYMMIVMISVMITAAQLTVSTLKVLSGGEEWHNNPKLDL